jgi:PAS domain S-box-containing protein
VNQDGRLKFWTPAFCGLLGYTDSELQCLNWVHDLVAPEFRSIASDSRFGLKVERPQARIESECIKKDGTRLPVELSINYHYAPTGEFLYSDSFVWDITDRKQAEQLINQERDFSSAILDRAAALVMVLDEDGRIVRFNRTCEEVTGYSYAEVVGKRPWEALVPEQYQVRGLNYFKTVSTGSGEVERENYWRTKDGGKRLISWSSSVLRDSEGAFKCIIGIGQDITEQRASDDALRQAEERFRIVAESASDLIYECECHGGKVNWFGDIDGLLGYAPGEFPRTVDAWRNAIHPDDRDRINAIFDALRERPAQYETDYRVVRRDGAILYWTERGRVLVDANGHPVGGIGAVSGVTERRGV